MSGQLPRRREREPATICCGVDMCIAILAFFAPPVAVCIKRGCCSADSLINILLCLLGVLPGIVHAWYIIAKYPMVEDLEGGAGGRPSHYYVQQGPPAQAHHQQRYSHERPRAGPGYGTVAPDHAPPPRQYNQEQAYAQSVQKPQHDPRHYEAPSSSRAPAHHDDEVRPSVPPPSYHDSVGMRSDHKVQMP